MQITQERLSAAIAGDTTRLRQSSGKSPAMTGSYSASPSVTATSHRARLRLEQRARLGTWRFFGDGGAVDKLYDGHGCRVTRPRPELQDAQVAAWTIAETRA